MFVVCTTSTYTLYMAFCFPFFLWYQVIVRWFCISFRQFDLGGHPLLIVIFLIIMKMFPPPPREREREREREGEREREIEGERERERQRERVRDNRDCLQLSSPGQHSSVCGRHLPDRQLDRQPPASIYSTPTQTGYSGLGCQLRYPSVSASLCRALRGN